MARSLQPNALLQLRIALAAIEPAIWRRVVVPDTITLDQLHEVIQAAMGWFDCHLHEFEIDGKRYGVPDPDWDEPGTVEDEHDVRLLSALGNRQRFIYTYDFGDHWVHHVTLEDTLPIGKPQRYADVGGPYGYVDFIEAISDSAHPEHETMLAWVGGTFNPEQFDLTVTNEVLKQIKL